MEELTHTNFSFKKLFLPLTSAKAIIIIIVIGVIVYANSLFNSFVYDDYGQIVDRPSVHSIEYIFDIFLNRFGGIHTSTFYRPIPYIFFTFIYFFSGENTFLYHLFQLIFHIGNTILIFLIFKYFLKQNISFLLALLFLVHPVNQETVVYISNLQDVLFVFFGLLSFYILQRDSKDPRNVIFANICLLLSLLSKETGVLFLVIDAIYVYIVKKEKAKFYIYTNFIVGIAYLCLRLAVQMPVSNDPFIPIMTLNFYERMINIPAIIFYYIRMLFFPWNLVSINTWIIKNVNFSDFYLPFLIDSIIFIILFSMCVYFYKRKKILGIFFFFWFLAGFTFHIQIIIPLDSTVANRWFYFPFIGLLGFIGVFFQTLRINKLMIRACLVIVILLLPVLMLRTIIRNKDWINQSTLLYHDIQLSSNDYTLEQLYADNLLGNHKNDEAYIHINKALSLYPKSYLAWNSLGIYYFNKKKFSESKKAYEKSIAIEKNYLAYQNLSVLLMHIDRSTLTRNFIKQAIKEYPNSENLWYQRVLIEYILGNYDDALLAARNYYLLKKDSKSYTIYNSLRQNIPLNIDLSK